MKFNLILRDLLSAQDSVTHYNETQDLVRCRQAQAYRDDVRTDLIGRVGALIEAIRPLAAFAAVLPEGEGWEDDRPVWEFNYVEITAGDVRRAARVLTGLEE